MKYRDHKPHRFARFISLGVFFAVCCAVFVARLVYYQIAVRENYERPVMSVSGNVRTVTVKAQRGNICDRNGKVIVTNSYTYDMQIEFGALPEDRDSVHRSLLGALDAIEFCGATRAGGYSVFEGDYPELSYTDEVLDPSTKAHAKLLSVLKSYYVDSKKYDYKTAEEALEKVSAGEFAGKIAEYYDIIEVKKDKTVKTSFTDAEIGRLVALRFDMEADGYGIYSPYLLVENTDERLISCVKESHLTGITFAAQASRKYLYPGTASHILGTVGKIYAEDADYYTSQGYPLNAIVGKTGCEYAFEKYLRGTDGTLAIIEDDKGYTIGTYWLVEPVAGNDVYLTVDLDVQLAAEKALADNVKSVNGAESGSVVACDPDTGEVIAMASYPTYDLTYFNRDYNELSSAEGSPLLNRSLSAYAPGSTFKVGVALAALETGTIDPSTVMHTEGIYRNMKCSHYAISGGHTYCCGDINVCGALEKSCNYFFGFLGDELGTDVISEYAEYLGLGEATGIEIGESEGRRATNGELAFMAAIGQSDNLFTPLQVTQYISAVATGNRYAAHLLYSVNKYGSGEVVLKSDPKLSGALSEKGISEANLMTVRQGMRDVVHGDNASSYVSDRYSSGAFYGAKYSVAGKTGTAEVAGQSTDNAWFTAYAPFDDPELSVTCLIIKGKTGGLASSAVREVFDAYFAKIGVKDENPGSVG